MSSEVIDIIIPSAFFFIAFFLAFMLAETLIILLLNRLMFNWWGFTVEKLQRSKELYGATIKTITLITIIILIAALVIFTDFPGILRASTLEIKVLASEIFLAMILIYLITTRRLPKLDVEKSIHKYLYIYLSIIVFTLTIISADRSYAHYKDFINANVTAVVGGVERKMEEQEKNALVESFRKQIYRGKCREINYLEEPGGAGVKNFVYVITNEDLNRAKTPYEQDDSMEKYFTGRECTNGIDTFLLTDHGRWYWVIDT